MKTSACLRGKRNGWIIKVKKQKRVIPLCALLLAIPVLIAGCMSEAEKKVVEESFLLDRPDPSGSPDPLATESVGGGSGTTAGSGGSGGVGGDPSVDCSASPTPTRECYTERFQQPDFEISRSIDLLFVMDTSGSMDDNRAKVASGISAFVGELPSDVDYQVAVMLAHGSKSSWSGKLFTYGGSTVFSSKTMSVSTISSKLKSMVLNTPTDASGEQGETGSYSLLKGLTTNLAANQAKGFFRSNAALAIVFVSDENDYCAPYVGMSTMTGMTSSEKNLRKRDCSSGISTASVIAQVKSVQAERPYLFGAVIHQSLTYSDSGGNDSHGWGYAEVVSTTNGVTTEINDGSYTKGLSTMGKLATIKLNLQLDFDLSHSNVDAATLRSYVDSIEVDHVYDVTLNEVHLSQGGTARSMVDLSYCINEVVASPSPSPSSSASVTPTSSPSASPTSTSTASPTPSASPTTTETATPSPTVTSSPTVSPTPTDTSSPSPTPSASETVEPCEGLSCGPPLGA